MTLYSTTLVRTSASTWSAHRPLAEVLYGTFQGKFVALTILVRGTGWICHPEMEGDEWTPRKACKAFPKTYAAKRPPRWVRKAAKMALRRWLNPSRQEYLCSLNH